MSEPIVMSNSLLTGILTGAVVDRAGYYADMDSTDFKAGIWRVSPSHTANIPSGIYSYGIVVVCPAIQSSDKYAWVYYITDQGQLCSRLYWQSGWRPWYYTQLQKVTT
ncbi:MAG: hypothetical protein HDS35_00010 [Bacteroides sp.]|nr:hypothetical protein [Bacteroides sp.]